MTDRNPSFSVKVEPTNPGQFLACCGLLELASRLWGEAEGWFEGDCFSVCGEGTLQQLLHVLVEESPTELTRLENGLNVKPLIAPLRFPRLGHSGTLTLDGWMTIRVDRGEVVAVANPPWNFWSGQQTSLRIWTALRAALTAQLETLQTAPEKDLFQHRVFLSGRFGFDPGAAWNALDAGFSPNEQGMDVASSAAVELLAAVGLQRFRPIVCDMGNVFIYATWGRPLATCTAASAAVAAIPGYPTKRYLGRVVSRGSYAALGYATPLQGAPHE